MLTQPFNLPWRRCALGPLHYRPSLTEFSMSATASAVLDALSPSAAVSSISLHTGSNCCSAVICDFVSLGIASLGQHLLPSGCCFTYSTVGSCRKLGGLSGMFGPTPTPGSPYCWPSGRALTERRCRSLPPTLQSSVSAGDRSGGGCLSHSYLTQCIIDNVYIFCTDDSTRQRPLLCHVMTTSTTAAS